VHAPNVAARHLQIAALSFALLAGAGPMVGLLGCHRNQGPNAAAVKQSLDGLQGQLGDLKTRFLALRKQVDGMPSDLPGFAEVRAKFYGLEEGRGIIDAKMTLLSSRLGSALSSGKDEELQQISKDVAQTYDEIREIDKLHVELLHQVMAFQRRVTAPAHN
jgi:hypothetical protein